MKQCLYSGPNLAEAGLASVRALANTLTAVSCLGASTRADNDNTDTVIEHPWLDVEDWEIPLRPYEDNPDAAVMLSINLAILQRHVAEPSLHSEAIEEIDRV